MTDTEKFEKLRLIWDRNLNYLNNNIRMARNEINQRKDKVALLNTYIMDYKTKNQSNTDAMTIKTTMHFCAHIDSSIKDLEKQIDKAENELKQKIKVVNLLNMKINKIDEMIEKQKNHLQYEQLRNESKQIEELFRNFSQAG